MANRTASTKTNGTAARSVRERIGRADRVHRATSADGTAIVGEVYGQGAPLVLVHAGLGHGTLDWAFALPSLTDQFTCYCMSTRGRGSSGDAADHSIERNVEDVTAFVESIGAPVMLAGPSGGAMSVLGAAARSDAVRAVVACDPLAFELLGEEDAARLKAAIERMAGLAEEGRLVDAARDWMTEWANGEEMAFLESSGWLEAGAAHVPVLLRLLEASADDGYSPTDPSVLGQVDAPTLVLLGSDAGAHWPWFAQSAQHVAEHVADAKVHEVAGAGHCGVWMQAERYAEAMKRFVADGHPPR